MEKQSFEYFKTDVTFSGKHRLMIDKLWEQNKILNSYVKRLLDLYALAAIIGIRINRKGIEDTGEDKITRTIQVSQLLKMPDLDTIMKTVLLLGDADRLSAKKRIDRAFRGPNSKEEFDSNVKLFNSYVLGGIEFLYEELVERNIPVDSEFSEHKVGNIAALLENDLLI